MSSSSFRASLLGLVSLLLLGWTADAISLLNGAFVTSTDDDDVRTILNLARDAALMREADDDFVKLDIYYNGSNATYIDGNGDVQYLSLGLLSLGASSAFGDDFMYNIFVDAFAELGQARGEDPGLFDEFPVEQYGDTIVNDLFSLNLTNIETEAALVMNVWMACLNQLYTLQRYCQGQEPPDKLQVALDAAAAFWIGADQQVGDADTGHLLYNLAEVSGEKFGQDNGEAWINTQIVALFNSLQASLQQGVCTTAGGYPDVRQQVQRLVSFMTVPLVQHLIHHMQVVEVEGSDFVELYALSILPRIAACDPVAYERLLGYLVFSDLDPADRNDALHLLQSVYPCLTITCDQVGSYQSGGVPACDDDAGVPVPLVGYTPTWDVRQPSYADRDILQLEVLMRQHAFDAAVDVYRYGSNMQDVSLYQLATNQVGRITYSVFDDYRNFFTPNATTDYNFLHQRIQGVFDRVGPYAVASDQQRAAAILGTLRHSVLFLTVVEEFESAIVHCNVTQNLTLATQAWDSAIAYYVGSIEGTQAGGHYDKGQLGFATAREYCVAFGTCVNGSAQVNLEMLPAFENGTQYLQAGDCDGALAVLDDTVGPNLPVALYQGLLFHAAENVALPTGSGESSLATGDAFAQAVVPILDQVNTASVQAIQTNMGFTLTSKPVPGGLVPVFDALRQALPDLDTDCEKVGHFLTTGTGVCLDDGDPSFPPTPSPTNGPTPPPTTASPVGPTAPPTLPAGVDPSQIAFGRYIFTDEAVAHGEASFALDARDMYYAPDVDFAREVYTNGLNAITTSLMGDHGLVSLASLSIDADEAMSEDLLFNLFRFALFDEYTFEYPEYANWTYADYVVRQALDGGGDEKLASEAAVHLNVWMVIAHRLYDSVRQCQQGSNPEKLIDAAVALWIGYEQEEGRADSGFMIYNTAQRAANVYGQPVGEAPVNTALMDQFNEAQTLASTCATNQDTSKQLRVLVTKILANLTKPLLQMMLFHMNEDNINHVELYALSVLPQAVGCDPGAYTYLVNALYSNYTRADMDEDLLINLSTFLKCMRYTCEDLGDISNADSGLVLLVSGLCDKMNATNTTSLAGYEPTSSVAEKARIDLDVLQIDILARTRAYRAATDIYLHGQNSYGSPTEFKSLHSLATVNNGPQHDVFTQYYPSGDTYVDNLIREALSPALDGDFQDASRVQRAELAVRALQCMVSYQATLSNFQTALDHCRASQDSQPDWDTGVAYFVGSIEGSDRGSHPGYYGKLLYTLGREMCIQFDTCLGNTAAAPGTDMDDGEAQSNADLISAFEVARDALGSGNGVDFGHCDQAESVMRDVIQPTMLVPFIQGTLVSSVVNEFLDAQAPNSTIATGAITALSVLPLVNEANATSAATVSRNMVIQYGDVPVVDGSDAVFEAFTETVRGMGVDCAAVGTLTHDGRSVCDPDVAPHPNTPTNLGDDLYVTTTHVQDRADIAKDIVEIAESLRDSQAGHLAEIIYEEGRNSRIFNANGIATGKRSLAGFSRNATFDMLGEPLFNIFMYALQDDNGQYLGRDARLYADSIVLEHLRSSDQSVRLLATEAMVVLNLWMYLAHQLYETLENCKNKVILDTDGILSIDEAVAYWIGDGQIAGDSTNGHLLYALAERMAEEFDIEIGGQARTNVNILRLFNEAKNELSFPNACSRNVATYPRLREIVNKIISQMTIPLVQGLIHSLRESDGPAVKLYAQAFVPLVAACDQTSFEYLKEKLIDTDFSGDILVEIETIIDTITTTYPCLGIQCNDIGVHSTEVESSCSTPTLQNSLAGYTPASDVREAAQIDLDLAEMNVLLQMNAYDAAKDLYMYGKHAVPPGVDGQEGQETLSLGHLAVTAERTIVPQFDSFVRYFNDEKYADFIIRQAFDDTSMPALQRRTIILKTCQFMVTYMTSLQSAHEAISDCESASLRDLGGSAAAWDRSAAYAIGSTHKWSLYGLGEQECADFGTCGDERSKVADELVTLFYAGRGAVLGQSCSAIRNAATELEGLLLVPLIQGTLGSVLRLEGHLPHSKDRQQLQAEAYIYSRNLLPIVDDLNRDASATIDAITSLGSNEPRGSESLFSAFAQVYDGMGVDCQLVGVSRGIDACTGDTLASERGPKETKVGMIVGILVGVIAVIAIMWLMRAKRSKDAPPTFITTSGELNHTEDFLLAKSAPAPKLEDALLNDASPPEDDDDVMLLADDDYSHMGEASSKDLQVV